MKRLILVISVILVLMALRHPLRAASEAAGADLSIPRSHPTLEEQNRSAGLSQDLARQQIFLPLVAFNCPPSKLGWAVAKTHEWIHWFDMCGGSYHYWDSNRRSVAPAWLEFVPTIKCDADEQWDIFNEFYGPEYDGYLIFANELNRDHEFGHCEDITPMSCYHQAIFYVQVKNAAPNAKLIGPVTDGNNRYDMEQLDCWWEAVLDLTGHPPDLYALSIHDYHGMLIPDSQLGPHVTRLQNYMKGRGVNLPIWVTEFGVGDVASMRNYVNECWNNAAIERCYYFAPVIPGGPQWPYPWTSLYDEHGLTDLGEAFFAPPD